MSDEALARALAASAREEQERVRQQQEVPSSALQAWAELELGRLGLEEQPEVAQHLLAIVGEEECEEFATALLGEGSARSFVAALGRRRGAEQAAEAKAQKARGQSVHTLPIFEAEEARALQVGAQRAEREAARTARESHAAAEMEVRRLAAEAAAPGQTAYRKKALDDEGGQRKKGKGRRPPREREAAAAAQSPAAAAAEAQVADADADAADGGIAPALSGGIRRRGQKQSTRNQKTADAGQQRPLVNGRVLCMCEAMHHRLIGNCLQCGLIVCEQHGQGSCLYCLRNPPRQRAGEPAARAATTSGEASAAAGSAYEGAAGGLGAALRLKEKLVQFNADGTRRTAVYDDQEDHFDMSSTQWLDSSERATLQQKHKDGLLSEKEAEAEARKRRVTIDFAGRRVVDETWETERTETEHAREASMPSKVEPLSEADKSSYPEEAALSTLRGEPAEFVPEPTRTLKNPDTRANPIFSAPSGGRVKAKALKKRTLLKGGVLQAPDLGLCMSMHQPWAGLLVAGAKRVEGRGWQSDHVGRLWIASTMQKVEDADIAAAEDFYTSLGVSAEFPSSYPTSTLLGFIDVKEQIDQEEYTRRVAAGELMPEENGSAYLFVPGKSFALPEEAQVPISGQHKIYKLEADVVQVARAAYRSMTTEA